MTTWLLTTLCAAALLAPAGPVSAAAQQGALPQTTIDLEGDVDIDEGSPWLKLADPMPAIVELLKFVGVALQDSLVSSRLNTQLGQLVDVIAPQVGDTGGYLLRVNLYTNEHGVVVIPGGQLLSALGPGFNPIDALAESMRQDTLSVSVHGGLRDSTSYIWIRRVDGKLVGRTFPRNVSKLLRTRAQLETEVRETSLAYQRSFPADPVVAYAHAEFWAEMERERLASIGSAAKRAEAQALLRRLEELQAEANAINAEYVRLAHDIAAAQRQARTLEVLGAITDIVTNSVKLGDAITIDGNAAKATSDVPFASADTQIEYLSGKITSGNRTLEYQRTTIERYEGEIRTIDQKLEMTYRDERIPVPDRR